jgi:serine/threonine-protein kinase
MASVYHAHDPRFKRDVALKLLPHTLLHDPTFRGRFEQEAQTIASLEHSAIVPVYDMGEQDEQPYLVMRFMSGGSLDDRIRHGALTITEAVPIFDRWLQRWTKPTPTASSTAT